MKDNEKELPVIEKPVKTTKKKYRLVANCFVRVVDDHGKSIRLKRGDHIDKPSARLLKWAESMDPLIKIIEL